MTEIKEYNEICTCNERPIYKKRYKDNGEEYLEKLIALTLKKI